jgi:hypothetical protein
MNMLKTLKIEATDDQPKIEFDKDNNILIIAGRSLPEDASVFFSPVIKWIQQYINEPNEFTELILKIEYLNSASVRKLTEILFCLETLHEKNHIVKVIWFYKSNDEVMKERGEEIKNVVELPFELRSETLSEL